MRLQMAGMTGSQWECCWDAHKGLAVVGDLDDPVLSFQSLSLRVNKVGDSKYNRLPHAGDFENKNGTEAFYLSPKPLPTGATPFTGVAAFF
ncbi:MAG: hypothetical protein EOO63_16905 [Hymenobacter sp.]|nr:MAG: hypothetical protein EOO63_16905 [Hymenobacter sp.]